MIDAAFLKDWLGLISTLIALGGVAYTWLTARARGNSDQIGLLEGKFASFVESVAEHHATLAKSITDSNSILSQRLDKIESEMEHMPDAEAWRDLLLALSDMKGGQGRMEEKMAAIERTVHRVEDYLLKKGGV